MKNDLKKFIRKRDLFSSEWVLLMLYDSRDDNNKIIISRYSNRTVNYSTHVYIILDIATHSVNAHAVMKYMKILFVYIQIAH